MEKIFTAKKMTFRRGLAADVRLDQRPGKLQADQVVALAMLHAQHLGAQVAGNIRQVRKGG